MFEAKKIFVAANDRGQGPVHEPFKPGEAMEMIQEALGQRDTNEDRNGYGGPNEPHDLTKK